MSAKPASVPQDEQCIAIIRGRSGEWRCSRRIWDKAKRNGKDPRLCFQHGIAKHLIVPIQPTESLAPSDHNQGQRQ